MGEIARTYPSRYQDGELIVIQEFSFLENVSRLLTAIQKKKFILNYVKHHLKAFSLQMLAAPWS